MGRGAGMAVCGTVALLLLAGCATPPDPDWEPPGWSEGSLHFVSETVSGGGSDDDSDGDGGSSGADSLPAALPNTADLQALGFVERRIRNDAAAVQLRYVEMPGVHAFDAQVGAVVDAAIADATSGAPFTPEVFGQEVGLAERGCIEGSLTLDAAGVLADTTTGPAGGSGLALICEVVEAFDGVVGVGFRTIAGTPDEVTADSTVVLYADLESGEAFDATALWADESAGALWTAAVERLRRDAGALSGEPLAEPDASQLAIAREALASARFTSDGGVRFVLPAGVAAPELDALGIEKTATAFDVEIDAETVHAWQSDRGGALQQRRAAPFTGLPEWTAADPIDCALHSCVALTYDDGPGPFTGELLDTLRDTRAAATFYMLGGAAQAAPEIVQRAAAEGHELGSHTVRHPDLTTVSPAQARDEVQAAADVLTSLTGQQVRTFRPPYGAIDDARIRAIGMPSILWTIDTNDWQGPGVEEVINRAVDPATPGDIILFHDIHADTVNAAPGVIAGLQDRGFTPVTVTQLFDGAVPEGRVSGR